MKLIWHIIKKDIVRDRWALLLWAALFGAQVVVGLVLRQDLGDDKAWLKNMQAVSVGLVIAQFVSGYVLVARLVQADVLLGTDMFWATRPITRRRLLLAKLAGAGLVFGLVPVALLAPWWLVNGFTARDVFWTGVDTFGWQLLMIAPAFLIASLTNEIGRVLLWTVLLFVAGMLWVVLLASLFQAGRGGDEPRMASFGVTYTRAWLAGLLFVLSALAVAAHQYLTNRLIRSGALTAVGAGLVIAAGLFLPWDWSTTLADLSAASRQELTGINAEVGYGLPNTSIEPRAGREISVITEIYFQGVPENLVINSGTSRQSWQWADGLRIRRWNFAGMGFMDAEPLLRRTYALAKPQEDPETRAWQKAKMEERRAQRAARGFSPPVQQTFMPPSRPGRRQFVYASVPEAFIKRAQKEPPAYEAALQCVVTQPVIVTDLPLRAGGRGGANSVQIRVMWLGEPVQDGSAAGLPASILVTSPMLRLNGLWLSAMIPNQRSFLRDEIWAINRSTGEVVSRSSVSRQSTRTAFIAGVLLSWNTPMVNAGLVIRDGRWVLRDPQWVEHTQLVAVSEEMVGRLNLDVKSDRVAFRNSRYLEEGESPPVIPKD